MKNDRLYIDNVLVDLGENVDITLVHNSNLFRDVTKMTGNTTYTIRLPRTANNAAVFGMAGDLRADTTYPTQYHRADYIRGGVPIITNGCAVLLSVTDMYEISISWGTFAPLATIVNDGMTLNQLGGTDTITFNLNNPVTPYAQAMTDGYYYALYDSYIRETSSEWKSYDVPFWNQGSTSGVFSAGAVITGNVGETIALSPTSRAGTQYIIQPFTFGMVAFVDGVTGAADAAAWCVVDAASNVIWKCDDLTLLSGVALNAPVKAAYIVINSTSGGTVSVVYYGRSSATQTWYDGNTRLPVVNVSWILDRIKIDTGVDFVFPYSVKAYLDTLALPLVTAKANALSTGGFVNMSIGTTYSLGVLGVMASVNTIFSEQSGTVYQLTATRSAKVSLDIQATYLWSYVNATPSGQGSVKYNGISETVKAYSFAPTYIEMKIVHTDPNADDTIYNVGVPVGEENIRIQQMDYENYGAGDFARLLAGSGEIEIVSGDVVTFTLINSRGLLDGFVFASGHIIMNENVNGEVQRGAQYPIVENLPEIKIVDFIKFLCAITATFPLNINQTGKVTFEEISTLFGSASRDWTTKIIPSHTEYEQAQETTYTVGEYARNNWYRWKEDETVLANYDGCLTINNDTLEAEHEMMVFPFAASDGNRVPIFEVAKNDQPNTLTSCEPRIMTVYQADEGYAALKFDIDIQDVIDTQMTGMAASLADVRVIKERIRMSDVELAAFDESMPVYLRQYGSFFAVLTLESSGDGTAIATMLRLRKSISQPVPPPPPEPYDYEVDYLESDGLAFIDTGIKASSNVEIQMYLADFFDDANKNKGAFGGRNGSGSSEFGMMLDNSGNVIIGNGSQITLSPYTNYSSRCHVEIGGGVWKIGAATGTYTPSTYESNYNVYLFAMNNSGGAVKGKCKIGATQITDGVTTLDLIPVVKNGVGYMYDRNTGTYYGNDGTSAFTWGNLPYDADIECLGHDGNQYIDTGITPNETIECAIRFMNTNAHVESESLLGARNTNQGGTRADHSLGIWTNGTKIGFNDKNFDSGWLTLLSYNTIYLAEIKSRSLYLDGVLKSSSGLTTTYEYTMSYGLLKCHYINNAWDTRQGTSGNLYYFRLWKNSALVSDYIPVRKNGVGYMYDRVTDTLFANLGTGDFVIGNDV